jgi:hypothetical protein
LQKCDFVIGLAICCKLALKKLLHENLSPKNPPEEKLLPSNKLGNQEAAIPKAPAIPIAP